MIRRRVALALWLMVVTVLYVFENNTGTRVILLTSWLMPVVSILCAVLCRRKANGCIIVPERCRPNEPFAVQIVPDSHMPLTIVQVQLTCTNLFNQEQLLCQTMLQAGPIDLQVTTKYAGLLAFEARYTVRDLFGLLPIKHMHTLTENAAVLPVVEPLHAALPNAEGRAESTGTQRRHIDVQGAEVREYQPGDPVRSIHWKLSQKLDKLLIREPEQQQTGELMLVINAADTYNDPALLDQLLQRVLAVSAALQQQGMPHRAVWMDRRSDHRCIDVQPGSSPDLLPVTLICHGLSMDLAPDEAAHFSANEALVFSAASSSSML